MRNTFAIAGKQTASAPGCRGRASRCAGFSLLEAVVALVMVSLLAALLVPVWSSSVQGTVAGTERLSAAHALRAEMEEWVLAARSVPFEDLSTAAATHFGAIGGISLIQNQWVEFIDGGGGTRTETVSPVPSFQLRVTIQHDATGLRLSRILSRPPA